MRKNKVRKIEKRAKRTTSVSTIKETKKGVAKTLKTIIVAPVDERGKQVLEVKAATAEEEKDSMQEKLTEAVNQIAGLQASLAVTMEMQQKMQEAESELRNKIAELLENSSEHREQLIQVLMGH